MNYKTIFLGILFILSRTLYSQEPIHFHENLIGGYRPLDSTALMNSIIEAAHQYEGNDVPRFAQFDFALPADSAEYFQLNGNAILLIIGFTHDSSELPFSKVYLTRNFKKYDLVKILDTKFIYSNSKVTDLFGSNSIVSFYFLPISVITNQQELKIDWMKNRKGFSFGKIDSLKDNNFKIIKLPKMEIDENFLKSFLFREFPLVAN
jgi:hypothetical protein